MVQCVGFDDDPAAAGIVEKTLVVVVVAGEGENLAAAAQNLVPIGRVKAGVGFVDRVVVVDLQRSDAVQVAEILRFHAAPDGMIVGHEAAVVAQRVGHALGHSKAVPFAFVDWHWQVF